MSAVDLFFFFVSTFKWLNFLLFNFSPLCLSPYTHRNTHFSSGLSEVKCWMSQNFCQRNENKSAIILFGPPKSQFSKNILAPRLQMSSCSLKPGCNIWQWPFIWKMSHKSCSIFIFICWGASEKVFSLSAWSQEGHSFHVREIVVIYCVQS